MKMRAKIKNSRGKQEITLEANGMTHSLTIPAKTDGQGSSISGGELLFLALATCFCNDLYREAGKLEIPVAGVEVEVQGEFGKEGEPASHIIYRARVESEEKGRLQDLIRVTDRMAEIQNTLRVGIPVSLVEEKTEKE
jgi:uncharacterized OsmC-like protein